MTVVQRARLPGSDRLVWLVVGDDHLPVEPIRRYLGYLDDVERSPNTLRAYAHHLKLFWDYLTWAKLAWTDVGLGQLARFNGVDLVYLRARYAVLSGMDLSGYTLDHSDLTGAALAGTRFDGARMDQAILRGVRGDKPVFDRAVLTGAYFDLVDNKDVQTNSSLRGASFNGANLQRANVSHADFSPAETGGGVFADFRKAQLNNLTAVRANFTGANLSGGVSMHGASFASATLARADMTGAVLGELSNIFTITTSDSEYELLLTALNAADVDGVNASFSKHHVQLASPTTITIMVAGKAWELKEDRTTYTVLLVRAGDGAQSLHVFQPASAGVGELSGAFMPDAILNDANLYGVHAHAVQLFPTTSSQNQLAGAIMNHIDLSDSILGSDTAIDMKQANLGHANLSGAFLVNAEMSGADLTGASLEGAQLQGANFTDADLTAASLVDAAVSSLILTSKDGTPSYGVPLFEVRLPDDALTDLGLFGIKDNHNGEYPFELATGADDGYANLLRDVKTANLEPVLAALKQNGVTLSTQTTIESDAEGSAWRLTDPTAGQSGQYSVWDGYDALGDKVIMAQPSVPNLSKLFERGYEVRLRWQATIRPIETADGSTAWRIDNDSENPLNLSTGYVEFLVTKQTNTLSVFGTLIHATRLVSIDKQEMGVFQVSGTVLCKNPPCDPDHTYLQSDTFCPNGAQLSANRRDQLSWAEMIHFATRLPLPPPCVPSPYAPCPQIAAVLATNSS